MNLFKRLFSRSDRQDQSERVYGATDVGRVRSGNEDYFLIRQKKNLLIASDGMGGHNAGEVASQKASESVDTYFDSKLVAQILGDENTIMDEMKSSLLYAHQQVLEMAREKVEYRGMGCTIVIALIDQNTLHLCHVGDARAYVCDKKQMKLLTKDHSVVMSLVDKGDMTLEEARTSPMKNELTQAIGGPGAMTPSYNRYELKPDERLLMCSDGLWDMLSDQEIFDIIRPATSIKTVCENLIEQANQAGGKDNITVVMAEHPLSDPVEDGEQA
ncbi:Stp1/IreP family PP2C-type Ser/Thr phosphatase [Desulfobacterales bacterium HSG16]|nr:Stp1/IreP family PP2C-type Ser/Thr phosphatase [Desulfobacterales bacterium HSG16]